MKKNRIAKKYGGGANESILGAVLKERPRDSFGVATKIGLPSDTRTGLFPKNISSTQFKAYFHNALDTSLKRLQLDYLDILYLYAPNNPDLIGLQPVKDVMLEVREEKRASFLGVSFHQNEPAMIRAAVDEKLYDVILTAYNFRQPHKEEVKSAIASAAKSGLGLIVMKTMAGVYWDKQRTKKINMKAALKLVLQNENIHTTVPGFTTFDQLKLDMSMMEDLTLTEKEKYDLNSIKKLSNGLYCDQCGRCQTQCPAGIDIPTLMRAYMYTYGYRNLSLAKDTIQSLDLSRIPCTNCTTCNVKCSMDFDIRNRILDITILQNIPEDFIV